MNDVVFTKGKGGLGRPLTGEDFISGLLLFNDTLPSGFGATDRVKKVNSLADAVALGIDIDYSDETPATGTYKFTAIGTNGDTLTLKVAEPRSTVSLGTFTKTAAESNVNLWATAYAALINAGTNTHGYSATASTDTVTITGRDGLGVFLNSGAPLTATIVGTIAGTLTAFSGGVASKRAIYWYHISEFFRIQPNGVLWIGVYATPGTYNFDELQTLQDASGGKIRQCGIFIDAVAFNTAHITSIQAICDTLESNHKPLSVLYAPNIQATAEVSALADITGMDSEKVSVIIGQDGNGFGWELWKATNKSISCLGATLGAVALAKVSDDIAWVANFNMSDGIELDTIAFSNGQTLLSQSLNTQNQLNSYRYIFLRNFVGLTGSYFNDSNVATLTSSDYAFIENNRTIDKAIRQLRTAYLPSLNSPLLLKADGTLANTTVAALTSVGQSALDAMVRDGELSNQLVEIDPTQNVLSTSQLIVSVKLQPTGVARKIQINIGFAASI